MAKQVRHGESEGRFVLEKRFCYAQNHWILRLRQHGRCHRPGRVQGRRPQNVWLANGRLKAEKLAGELGCNTTTNAEVAARCDLIFLGVKPQMMEKAAGPAPLPA